MEQGVLFQGSVYELLERKWEQHHDPAFDRSITAYYEAKTMLVKNVLEQLGYDIKEVVDTKGECVIHHIVWFSRAWEIEQVEYLQVDNKVVGEVRLVNGDMGYRWEGKVYE